MDYAHNIRNDLANPTRAVRLRGLLESFDACPPKKIRRLLGKDISVVQDAYAGL